MTLSLTKDGRLKVPECGKNGVQQACREALEQYGAIVTRTQAGVATIRGRHITLGKKGQPDLLATWPRFVLWVETKSTDGRLSEDQRVYHSWLRAQGYTVLVPHSADELLEFLASRKKEGVLR